MRVKIDTKDVRGCKRKGCTNPPPYYRHHLGNDGLLAAAGFTWARKTYHRYLSCREVCDECHMACHYLYEQILPYSSWNIWPGTLKQAHKRFTDIRNRFIQIGKRFLDGKLDPPVIPPEYREKWARSHSIWKARRTAKGEVKSTTPLNPYQVKFSHE